MASLLSNFTLELPSNVILDECPKCTPPPYMASLLSDMIGAAQIPAAPNFFYTVSPDPFLRVRCRKTSCREIWTKCKSDQEFIFLISILRNVNWYS